MYLEYTPVYVSRSSCTGSTGNIVNANRFPGPVKIILLTHFVRFSSHPECNSTFTLHSTDIHCNIRFHFIVVVVVVVCDSAILWNN